jgi:transcriptional regulator with XRE-family HTH domain
MYGNVRHRTRRPILKALKMARADAGLTISELAQRAGVSRDTISNAERGHHGLQATTLNKIARALGKTPSELLAEEERLSPKALRRSPAEPSLFEGLEEERHHAELEDGPSLEEFLTRAGCTTDWLLKPASEWYAAFRAKSREEAREKVFRIAREVEHEYLAIEPELFDAMRREKALHPGNVWRRGTYHALWQAAVGRYIQVWNAMEKTLADTDDPLPEPDFPTADVGDDLLISKTNKELEEVLEKRSEDKAYALS